MFGSGLVKTTNRLIKDQYTRTLEQCAGNGNALTLSAGQANTVLTNFRLVALRQLLDDGVNLRHLAGGNNFFEVGMRIGQLQILIKRTGEQARLLRNDAEVRT